MKEPVQSMSKGSPSLFAFWLIIRTSHESVIDTCYILCKNEKAVMTGGEREEGFCAKFRNWKSSRRCENLLYLVGVVQNILRLGIIKYVILFINISNMIVSI